MCQPIATVLLSCSALKRPTGFPPPGINNDGQPKRDGEKQAAGLQFSNKNWQAAETKSYKPPPLLTKSLRYSACSEVGLTFALQTMSGLPSRRDLTL